MNPGVFTSCRTGQKKTVPSAGEIRIFNASQSDRTIQKTGSFTESIPNLQIKILAHAFLRALKAEHRP